MVNRRVRDSVESLSLRVTEGLPEDVGRGTVRMDARDMAALSLQPEDVVRVTGRRSSVAKVLPWEDEATRPGKLRVDGLTRENCQAGIGDPILVQPTEWSIARTVNLVPLGEDLGALDAKLLVVLLAGVPVVAGDRVRANFLAGSHREFTVSETTPRGAVLIAPSTTVRIKGETAYQPGTGVTYEDVGGLRKPVQRIREMVELPLRFPELFERLGIAPPKGVLLYGPPGCGKTLVAKALANETAAYFAHISGPEIMAKYYGESEERLRKLFEEAEQRAPAILFIDEIDAVAPKREEMGSQQQVERRVVGQFLALMDGLKARGQVAVIGATNAPQLIDPALRRPGRFDREINIGVPDLTGRREILQVHTRGMPLAEDVSLDKLAEITYGFVGADLAALSREAGMVAMRSIAEQIPLDADTIPTELLAGLSVSMEDFLDAFTEVEPSALREVFTEIPDVRWDEVGGLDEAKATLKEVIEWPLTYADVFAKASTSPPKGILLTGPSGTGKTLLAKAVASECGVNFISVKGPQLLSKWVGDSERMIREIFKIARLSSPCIIFFDEIESIASRRGSVDLGPQERVISQLLTEMDGIEELRGVVILAATSRPDLLDPALLRPGRFEVRLELPVPDRRDRLSIFEVHLRGKPCAADVDLGRLADETEGFVGADIEAVCRRASMDAIREVIDRGEAGGPPAELELRMRHLQEAVEEAKKHRAQGP